jgi:hypothetical protein
MIVPIEPAATMDLIEARGNEPNDGETGCAMLILDFA